MPDLLLNILHSQAVSGYSGFTHTGYNLQGRLSYPQVDIRVIADLVCVAGRFALASWHAALLCGFLALCLPSAAKDLKSGEKALEQPRLPEGSQAVPAREEECFLHPALPWRNESIRLWRGAECRERDRMVQTVGGGDQLAQAALGSPVWILAESVEKL